MYVTMFEQLYFIIYY